MENKIVFITGADGLLGSNLVRELLSRNYKIRALIQTGRKVNTLDGLAIEKVEGDLLDANSVIVAMKGADFVIHAAASTSIWPNRNPFAVRVNIEGTNNILNACKENKIARLVYVGTANSFGFGSKENPGTEKNPYKSFGYGLDYMDSKYQAHQNVLKAVESGLDAVIVNPTFMLGPYDSMPSSGAMVIAIAQQKVPGFSPGGRNYICVKDAAFGIANALTLGRKGESYIIGNENLSYKEIFTKIATTVGVKAPGFAAPKWLLLLMGRFNNFKARFSNKAPRVSYTMAKISCDEFYFSAAKAVEELKLPQTPVEEGIKEAYDWFIKNNYLKPNKPA